MLNSKCAWCVAELGISERNSTNFFLPTFYNKENFIFQGKYFKSFWTSEKKNIIFFSLTGFKDYTKPGKWKKKKISNFLKYFILFLISRINTRSQGYAIYIYFTGKLRQFYFTKGSQHQFWSMKPLVKFNFLLSEKVVVCIVVFWDANARIFSRKHCRAGRYLLNCPKGRWVT